jgi:formylglycine-generating enzyme required for sulfatase activity
MILVEQLPAANSYYIDSTEVTVRQYAAFLAAKGSDVSGQSSECDWNTTYAPIAGEVTSVSDLPMTYVDWCDAKAYCAWAGKRLCGKTGGGALPMASIDDPAQGEWLAACEGPSLNWHPSLDTTGLPLVPCNDYQGAVVQAGTTCEGSYPGLFDMEGNAAEWVDSCDGTTGAADNCELAGGNYTGVSTKYCYTDYVDRRDARYPSYGFRCCASA